MDTIWFICFVLNLLKYHMCSEVLHIITHVTVESSSVFVNKKVGLAVIL
jgi:hypothetical protein